ncbi:MAG: hypothetical protein WB297_14980 [Actinomycetota bacterium]
MSVPEETSTFRDVRVAHRRLRKVVHAQNKALNEVAARERQMRDQLQHLPEPGLKATQDLVRHRHDLTLSQALALVSEVFADE